MWTEGGPVSALNGFSGSGWIEGVNFLEWFKKFSLPATQHLFTGPGVVLFVDGDHSHPTIALTELGSKENIHLM